MVRKKTGLSFWMQRVLQECDRAALDFAPDPVHDLRVALRRCRSMADGVMAIDPDPAWKEMKKAGRRLFRQLGELRDVHIMQEWVHKFDTVGDPVTSSILQHLAARETELRQLAFQALEEFDRKQWRRWGKELPRRAARLRQGSAIFKHLALERWTEAYDLHRRALRNRSQTAFHQLRIGIKRFRYIVENFLPQQHEAWKDDLKEMQDLLGEVHDLDVLWATALQVAVFPDAESKSRWHGRILEERSRRIEKYHVKMVGPNSRWNAWRAELPHGEQIEKAALLRLKLWASLLDPDFTHSTRVANLALQLYDGLQAIKPAIHEQNSRKVLHLAALLHDVGRSHHAKGHHKETYRLVHRLRSPLGIRKHDLDAAAIVARYHRGALPRTGKKTLKSLPPAEKREIQHLAGILRLANAFDAERNGHTQRLQVSQKNGFFTVAAQGYSARSASAETVAAARHLLEVVYRRPVMIRPLRPRKPRVQRRVPSQTAK